MGESADPYRAWPGIRPDGELTFASGPSRLVAAGFELRDREMAMRQFVLFMSFLAGAALVFWGAVQWGYDPLWPLWVVAGLGVMAGTIVTVRRGGRQRREALLAGEDVLARWQLSQADLDAFHAVDTERKALGMAYRNFVNIPATAPPDGVPIIIGKREWLIGTRLYSGLSGVPGGPLLCNVAMIGGDPGYIEIATADRSSGAGHFMLLTRLPVPKHARSVAQAAAARIAARVHPQNAERLQRSFPDYLRSLPR